MTGIETVGPKLRKAREAQKKTLADIAQATRISPAFLKDIEAGIMPRLPSSYVTAFVRAYAREVELDAAEWEHLQVDAPTTAEDPGRMFQGQTGFTRPQVPGGATQQGKILFALSAGLVATLTAILFLVRQPDAGAGVDEVPFSEVIREHETMYAEATLPFVSDSTSFWKSARADSLTLDAVASDTVWIRMVIDGGWLREYSMLPGSRLKWKGRESFILSLEDGGAVSFALNGKTLGILGRQKRPLWNARIDRGTVPRQYRGGGAG